MDKKRTLFSVGIALISGRFDFASYIYNYLGVSKSSGNGTVIPYNKL
jgi:hypothetical protein